MLSFCMFYKSSIFFIFLFLLLIGTTVEFVYIYSSKSVTQQTLMKKNLFVKVTSLPDLALCTETRYIRHRSMSDLFSLYKDDGTLREYAPSTFTYAPSKILYEK